jgi:hypothetical protein
MKKMIPILYKLLKDQRAFLFASVMLTLFFGLWGYMVHPDVNGARVIIKTFGLFAFSLENTPNILLIIAEFFATVTIFFGVAILFFKDFIDRWTIMLLQKAPYTLLIGLGEQNSIFLDQLQDSDTSVLVIESDSNNSHIEDFKSRGIGVIIAKAEDALSKLNLNQLQNCIVSTGNDRRNIAIGLLLMDKLNEKHQKLFVRIENRDLSVLFKQKVIESHNNVDIITYSLYENMAKALFGKHTVLGLQSDIVDSNKTFSTVVVGSSPLAVELIYQLAMLSTLPNENKFRLHLVAPDATRFYAKLQKLFTGITKIPHLSIKCTDLAYDDIAFYQDKVWNSRSLTNIIIATEDEEQNIDIAINLQDTTYLDKSTKGTLKTKVLFALYHDLGLGKAIDENKDVFANFYSFASMMEAASPESLIDEELDMTAKLINNNYTGGDEVNIDVLNEKWMTLSAHDKGSNKAQALHIDTKLVALGLKKQKSDKALSALIRSNTDMLQKIVPKEEISIDFPKKFDTLLSRVARSEHNRWNTFHYLNGWEYNKKRDDKAKRHPCLLPFSQFDTDDLKETYQYDVSALVNIPIYLAHAGYELVELEHA